MVQSRESTQPNKQIINVSKMEAVSPVGDLIREGRNFISGKKLTVQEHADHTFAKDILSIFIQIICKITENISCQVCR